jgi:ABC-type glycerol-3-phosphate transport system permease component
VATVQTPALSTEALAGKQRRGNIRARITGSDFVIHLLMAFVAFLVLLPIIWIVATSFKNAQEFYTNSASLIPLNPSLVNFEYMFTAIRDLPIYMRNSFILAIGTTSLQVFVSALAGYAFARMQFRGRDLIFILLLLSIFVPRAGGLMALYELMNFLKLRNSLFGLILLFASGVPIPIFIMRQAFLAIPKEIEESALIDGAGWFQVFRRIALPLAASAIVVVAILSFVGVWSDYLVTYTLIDKSDQMTISVGIQKVLTISASYETATAATHLRGQFASEAADAAMLMFSAVPVVLVYGVLQRWFMRGLTEGALKF